MHDLVWRDRWRAIQEQVNMIRHDLERDNDAIQRFRIGRQQAAQIIF